MISLQKGWIVRPGCRICPSWLVYKQSFECKWSGTVLTRNFLEPIKTNFILREDNGTPLKASFKKLSSVSSKQKYKISSQTYIIRCDARKKLWIFRQKSTLPGGVKKYLSYLVQNPLLKKEKGDYDKNVEHAWGWGPACACLPSPLCGTESRPTHNSKISVKRTDTSEPVIAENVARDGSFKETELSRLSSAKPAKV